MSQGSRLTSIVASRNRGKSSRQKRHSHSPCTSHRPGQGFQPHAPGTRGGEARAFAASLQLRSMPLRDARPSCSSYANCKWPTTREQISCSSGATSSETSRPWNSTSTTRCGHVWAARLSLSSTSKLGSIACYRSIEIFYACLPVCRGRRTRACTADSGSVPSYRL